MNIKRIIEALKNTIIFSALIHLLILEYAAIKSGDITIMNYLNILDIELFFPNIIEGTLNQWLALFVGLSIVTVFYYTQDKNDNT